MKKVIVIGASTGGPTVIRYLIGNLNKLENTSIFIAQHMTASFTSIFAKRLNEDCKVDVVECYDNQEIKPNVVYIAKGGYHMEVQNGRIMLNDGNPIHGVKPAVDKLFCSVAKEYGEKVIGIVLTGMGKDGAYGISEIKDNGGVTIAQNQETSTVFGMPKVAIETGKVDYVLSVDEILEFIHKKIKES